ncbi:MAG: hypothetical protein ACTSYD_09365 [Candidatus Heimdallarchaeaceae archaeon]
MYLENEIECATKIKDEIPGLSDVAYDLATTLKEARFSLDKVFRVCSQQGVEIDLTEEEQNELSMKVALVSSPQNVIQYARLVQLVFQLNYFLKCFEKAINSNLLPKKIHNEIELLYSKLDKYRALVESEYVTKI